MNFVDSLKEAAHMVAGMFSRSFLIFVFGVLVPLFTGILVCGAIITWTIFTDQYILAVIVLMVGVGWFFFWLNFTDDWVR